jgi:plasmid replication initiation protein
MARSPQSQLDLFIATASDLSPKSHQDLMARNWFSLSTRKRTDPIEHSYNDDWVKITGANKHGIATIFDNDVLIFVVAQYMNAINQGGGFNLQGMSFSNLSARKNMVGQDIKNCGNLCSVCITPT